MLLEGGRKKGGGRETLVRSFTPDLRSAFGIVFLFRI